MLGSLSFIENHNQYFWIKCYMAFFLPIAIFLLFGNRIISFISSYQRNGQPIRDCGPESHAKKAGTPTMGGIIIFFTALIPTFLLSDLSNNYVQIGIFSILSFGLLGFADDYLKVKKSNHKGILAKSKLLFQLLFSVILVLWVKKSFCNNSFNYTKITIPFLKNLVVDVGYFYTPFAVTVIVGSSNAVNLTDGLDGLAIFPIIVCISCFGIILYMSDSVLQINTKETLILCCSLIGSGLGFLWFNAKPAQIFMGDVGSLAFGAFIGFLSIITKNEITLLIIGGIFVVESLSVIIQVLYFKKTSGKRFFRMAPIHHHFEKLGLEETKIVTRFWIISIILAIIGLISI